MAILYTIGNLNLGTVRTVAKSIKIVEPHLEIDKVIIFNSKESEKIYIDQINIYREYFGDIIYEGIRIEDDGTIDSGALFSAFNNKDEKIVDLSNGEKATTSNLFMAASLCQIDKIYYSILKKHPPKTMILGEDYDYIKMRKMDCTDKLAKISCFDLIYYYDEISKLFTQDEIENNAQIKAIYEGIISGIAAYFSSSDFRTVLSNITIGYDNLIEAFIKFLRTNPVSRDYSNENHIDLYKDIDPIRIMTFFYNSYCKKGTDIALLKLATVPYILETIRQYRNIAAHNGINGIHVTEDMARTAINMSIEALKTMHENTQLWSLL